MNQWIDWVKQLKAISQIGTTYSQDVYDLERYHQLSAIAHAMFARLADAPIERVDNFFLPDQGYATPKVDLRGAVFHGDQVLLVRERSDGCWALPGGWADVCETPRQGVAREIWEESGYQVQVERLAVVRDYHAHRYQPKHPTHIYKLFFLCSITGGVPTHSAEIAEVAFFPITALPQLSLGRTLPEDIELLYEYRNDEHKPVYCD